MKCHYCETTKDLRPYGPNSAMVCFSCAMATPQRKLEAERNFGTQLNAIEGMALIDGSSAGVYPAKHNPRAMEILAANDIRE